MDYPQQRLIALKRDDWTCVQCGEPAKHVHHKDENKSNPDLPNLVSLCVSCHHKIHKRNRGEIKLIKGGGYGLKNRSSFTGTLRNDLYENIREYSKKTGIPLSKILDKALESYFSNLKGGDSVV
jgi:hypothetical protein